MLGKPPGVLFFGTVGCLCAYSVVMRGTLGIAVGVYGLHIVVPLLLGVFVIAIRIVPAVVGMAWTPASVVRVCAGPVLLVVTAVLAFSGTPERVRLALSERALDDYARAVTATECSEESFRPRRVGMYTVTCAQRLDNGRVLLSVRDRLTPPQTGVWQLFGPDPWELHVQD